MRSWIAPLAVAALLTPLSVLADYDPVADRSDQVYKAIPLEGQSAAETVVPTGPSGSTRGIVLYDNGPFVTGPVAAGACVGAQSLLQNTTQCLNTLGAGANIEAGVFVYLADDFSLSTAATISTITVYAYETGAVVPSITGGRMRIHPALPVEPNSPAIATSTTVAVAILPAVFRQTETGANATVCTRRPQSVTFTFAPPVAVSAATTYWLSYALIGGASAGPFCPAVTLIGASNKPGANAMQSTTAGGAYVALTDIGVTGCVPPGGAPPWPQDMPFVIEGAPTPTCDGDADGDGDTDQDDLDLVLFNFGTAVPPGTNGDVDGDGDVDQDDLDLVLFNFGCV